MNNISWHSYYQNLCKNLWKASLFTDNSSVFKFVLWPVIELILHTTILSPAPKLRSFFLFLKIVAHSNELFLQKVLDIYANSKQSCLFKGKLILTTRPSNLSFTNSTLSYFLFLLEIAASRASRISNLTINVYDYNLNLDLLVIDCTQTKSYWSTSFSSALVVTAPQVNTWFFFPEL